MALSFAPNIVAGSRFRYSPTGGVYVTVHDVFGLTPSADNLVVAIGQGISQGVVPAYASPHPTIQGFFLSDYESEPIQDASRTGVKVYCIFRTAEWLGNATFIEVIDSGGTKVFQTWTYGPQKGQPILVGYSPGSFNSFPSPIPVPPPPDSGKFYSRVELEALSPNMILQYTRRDTISPLILSRQYRRKVNASTWQLGAPGTWLCRSIVGKNQPVAGGGIFPGGGWVNQYSFEWDPDGWGKIGVFTDLYSGQTPLDIKFDNRYNGWQPIMPYDSTEFNSLNLPNAS